MNRRSFSETPFWQKRHLSIGFGHYVDGFHEHRLGRGAQDLTKPENAASKTTVCRSSTSSLRSRVGL